jgi:hypothetical protein
MFTVVDIFDSLLKGIPHFLALGPALHHGQFDLFHRPGIAAISRNERYHKFFAVFYLG